MDNDELLRELDAFLDRYGIADSTFGIRCLNDSHLVARIRAGRTIRRSTILKIRNYIADFEARVAMRVKESDSVA
jgi:hypothetical protein